MDSLGTVRPQALLCNLEDETARELASVLAHQSIGLEPVMCTGPPCGSAAAEGVPFVLFCPSTMDLRKLLDAVSGENVPVIVVSRTPNSIEWVEAMEAGASDYCAAPFEVEHVRWIVKANTPKCVAAAA